MTRSLPRWWAAGDSSRSVQAQSKGISPEFVEEQREPSSEANDMTLGPLTASGRNPSQHSCGPKESPLAHIAESAQGAPVR